METTNPSLKTLAAHNLQFPPLEQITKPNLTTTEAAYYLCRKEQTLRIWAMNQHPIRPRNINGRLAWPVADIRALLSGGAA